MVLGETGNRLRKWEMVLSEGTNALGRYATRTDQARCLGIRNPAGQKDTGTDDKNGSAMVAASVKRLDCKNWS